LFVHGRTRQAGYSGPIDYEAIRTVKNSVSIPVFGSGNVMNVMMAEKMFTQTGCDGILVARGSFGNPWLARDIENYLKKGTLPPEHDMSVKIKILRKHLSMVKRYKSERAIGIMRKVALWYIKGFPNACRIRNSICRLTSYEKLLALVNEL
jgi:tRNA-dihydrouridine synthase B